MEEGRRVRGPKSTNETVAKTCAVQRLREARGVEVNLPLKLEYFSYGCRTAATAGQYCLPCNTDLTLTRS